MAAAAAAGAAPLPRRSFNQPLQPAMRALIVPLAAVANPGAPGRKRYCTGTRAPTHTAAQLRKAVFQELAGPGEVTVGSTYTWCTHGKLALTQANSAVPEVVELPCTGKSQA